MTIAMTIGTTRRPKIDTGATSHTPALLEITRWRDPMVERVGFDACGEYVELFWLPIIGPTSTWLLRRLAVMAILHPSGFAVDARNLSGSLGLGSDVGPRSSFVKSLNRLMIFGLLRAVDHRHEVRTAVPPLTLKHLARLPENLQSAHSLWAEVDPSPAHALAYAGASRHGAREWGSDPDDHR